MTEITWLWVILAAATLLDLVTSAAKSAFTHVRLPYLLTQRENGTERLDRTIVLMEKSSLWTALRLGLALTHFWVAGALVLLLERAFNLQDIWVILLILLGVLLILSVFEYSIEKNILDEPESSAIQLTGVASLINFIFYPASKAIVRLLGQHAEKVTLSVTDEALRDWVEVGQPESSLEKGEREMIYSIFHFGETLAKEIMVPRMDLLALDINTTISEARQEFIDAGHSRVPIYEDTIDNVVGLLYAKDLLSVVDGSDTIASQRQLLRPAYFVPEAKKVDELLTEMQSRGIHMALVVDEYGGVAGVVTLEDIVEEIVGEIRDEYDTSEEQLFEQISADEYIFLGRATIDEVNETTGLHLSKEHADTLGGYIYGELGRVPQPGETVEENGVQFIVEEVVARRILKVRAKLLSGEEQPYGNKESNASPTK